MERGFRTTLVWRCLEVAMSDRELLEKAAKSAGLSVIIPASHQRGLWIEGLEDEWNPLTDDGDALRLAVQLGLTIDMVELAVWHKGKCVATMPAEGDPYAATRRAIVRAVAQIGEQHGN